MRNRKLQDRPPARRTPHLGDPVASVPDRLLRGAFGGRRSAFTGHKKELFIFKSKSHYTVEEQMIGLTEIGIVVAGLPIMYWYIRMARELNPTNLIKSDEIDRFIDIAKTGVLGAGIALAFLVNADLTRSTVATWKIKVAPLLLLATVGLGIAYMTVVSRQFQVSREPHTDYKHEAAIRRRWSLLINALSLGALFTFLIALFAVADIIWGIPTASK
jgi:hypothetical protein